MIRSEDINEVLASLHAVQGEIGVIQHDAKNTFHNSSYATLGAVFDELIPLLQEHKLTIVQTGESTEDGRFAVETVLFHESGQYIGSRMVMPTMKPDPQALGSAYTYARRYMAEGLIGITTDDDDGNTHREALEQRRNAANVSNRQSVLQNAPAKGSNPSPQPRSAPETVHTSSSTQKPSQGTQTQYTGTSANDGQGDMAKRLKWVRKIQDYQTEITKLQGQFDVLDFERATFAELESYGKEIASQVDRLRKTREGEKATGRSAGRPRAVR